MGSIHYFRPTLTHNGRQIQQKCNIRRGFGISCQKYKQKSRRNSGMAPGFLERLSHWGAFQRPICDYVQQDVPGGNAGKFSENVFRTFDTNNSGTIDFREFMLALHVTSSGTPEEKLTWAFRMYDVDGSGSIDFGEMKRIVSAVYEMIGAYGDLNKAHELLSKMDQNSDGLVSQDEFIAMNSSCDTH